MDDWSGAKGLAEDVRRYGAWMREEAEKRIGYLYPKVEITKELAKGRPDLTPLVGRKLTVIVWLWARTVKSPNPAFADIDVPLASTFVLSSKAGKEAYIESVVERRGYRFAVKVGKPKDAEAAKSGTKLARGANFRCLMSGTPISGEYIKAEGNAGRMGARLLAVVAEGDGGRLYLSPNEEQERVALEVRPTWAPDQEIAYDPHSGATYCVLYGLRKFSDLFTRRQLVALTTFSKLVEEARERVAEAASVAGQLNDDKGLSAGGRGSTAYAEAVSVYLALAVDRMANTVCTVARWTPERQQTVTVFSRQAISMTWDFPDVNPFAGAAGDFEVSVNGVLKGIPAITEPPGIASQADASTQEQSQDKVVSTDPPYYDNVPYADLSDFFYVFATLVVPRSEELVASPLRHGGPKKAEAFFLDGMTRAMHRLSEQAHPAFPVTIYYAFKQTESDNAEGTASTGWETFLEAVLRAGFAITGTWPMRTELANRMRGAGWGALASSIILVCRSRSVGISVSRKEFLRELDHALPDAVAEMIADPVAAIAPVDLAQACIGPGMALFSKHEAVLEADGSAMPVRSALVYINKAIDDYFAHAEGGLDADTRFCIDWFQQYGFESGPFGEADVLARAKGTAVNGVVDAGVLSAAKGKVRILRIKEYPKDWDPATDNRVPIWEACHHMCRALGESEHEAGILLARMSEKQDAIRQLSYRLYTICERQKWAEEARAYNDLITSWPAIVEQSHKVGHTGTQLELV
jgi:putative DNA methylase